MKVYRRKRKLLVNSNVNLSRDYKINELIQGLEALSEHLSKPIEGENEEI